MAEVTRKRNRRPTNDKNFKLEAEYQTKSEADLKKELGLEVYQDFEKYIWNENAPVKIKDGIVYFFTSDVLLFKHHQNYQKLLAKKREATRKKQETNNG